MNQPNPVWTMKHGRQPFPLFNETIGPELGFGWVMGDALDAPVLLMKCAWGGKSLADTETPERMS